MGHPRIKHMFKHMYLNTLFCLTIIKLVQRMTCQGICNQALTACCRVQVGELRSQLESRVAQQTIIEAEIARQLEDYWRLKKQLISQEELQVKVLLLN